MYCLLYFQSKICLTKTIGFNLLQNFHNLDAICSKNLKFYHVFHRNIEIHLSAELKAIKKLFHQFVLQLFIKQVIVKRTFKQLADEMAKTHAT